MKSKSWKKKTFRLGFHFNWICDCCLLPFAFHLCVYLVLVIALRTDYWASYITFCLSDCLDIFVVDSVWLHRIKIKMWCCCPPVWGNFLEDSQVIFHLNGTLCLVTQICFPLRQWFMRIIRQNIINLSNLIEGKSIKYLALFRQKFKWMLQLWEVGYPSVCL